jgi:hypothetical protein
MTDNTNKDLPCNETTQISLVECVVIVVVVVVVLGGGRG